MYFCCVFFICFSFRVFFYQVFLIFMVLALVLTLILSSHSLDSFQIFSWKIFSLRSIFSFSSQRISRYEYLFLPWFLPNNFSWMIVSCLFKEIPVPNLFSTRVFPIRVLSKIYNEHELILARVIALCKTTILVLVRIM